ncbi:MAG: hypothetical protein EOM25_03765 [Deltaproteobacteria bacterium]|nr:hypothetical protein [Deltaproteobacteria bacterium]
MLLTAAISPCPNDTWIHASWIMGLVEHPGLARDDLACLWSDIAELNDMAVQARAHVIKISAVQALRLGPDWTLLASGGAFGLGQGPRIVILPQGPENPKTMAVPGLSTTAFALARSALSHDFKPVPMRFDLVPGAVLDGRVDAGLLIHETALVHSRLGLELLVDLGQWWAQRSSGLPLPLGVCVAATGLGPSRIRSVDSLFAASLEFARRNPETVMPLVRALARELDDSTLKAHIDAYVNNLSLDMGPTGKHALELLGSLLPDAPRAFEADPAHPNHLRP